MIKYLIVAIIAFGAVSVNAQGNFLYHFKIIFYFIDNFGKLCKKQFVSLKNLKKLLQKWLKCNFYLL